METSSLCSLIVGWGAGPAWACLSGRWVLVGRASLLRRLPDLEWLQVARDDKLTEGEKKKKNFQESPRGDSGSTEDKMCFGYRHTNGHGTRALERDMESIIMSY